MRLKEHETALIEALRALEFVPGDHVEINYECMTVRVTKYGTIDARPTPK